MANRPFIIKDRLGFGGIALTRGKCQPIHGLSVSAPRLMAAIHYSERSILEWRASGDRLRSKEVSRNNAYVIDARSTFWVRSRSSLSFVAVSLETAFVKQIWESEFGRANDFEFRNSIGVRDAVIETLGHLARKELDAGGMGGRLFTEGLGTALAVHLLREYSGSPRANVIRKGGLSPRSLRLVAHYVIEHLQDELGLGDLAKLAMLSPHHFAVAFKASTGLSPHQYVIRKRVEYARDLLSRKDDSISQIAYASGFSSQSHLTANFRRMMGMTPKKFRESQN